MATEKRAKQETARSVRYSGRLVNERRRPVAHGQIIRAGKIIGTTGKDGVFAFDMAANGKRIPVTFAAPGYVSNTRLFDSRAAGNGTTVVIWAIANRITFDAELGLEIGFGSTSIRVEPGSLVDGKGARLGKGTVLEFTHFDITNQRQRAAITGDFKGQMKDRTLVQLNSFGVFELNIRDRKGGEAALAQGRTIELAIAVPERLAPRAPKTIPFFDFDRGTGNWVEVSNFAWSPNTLTYNGHVERFGGAQNLDVPARTTCVTIRTMDYWGNVVPFASVTVQLSQSTSYGTSDANGYVCLLVERNMPFTPTAYADVGSSHYTTTGPTVFMAPDIASDTTNCGDPTLCPYLGDLPLDLAVGFPH